jgi:hypothetical protein
MSNPYAIAGMAAFQIINGLQQAELTRQQGEITDMINEANQEFAMNDAFEVLASGMTEEARYDNVIKSVMETQKAELAYEGVDANYGSAADLQAETAVQGLVNKVTIKNNAYAQSLGIKYEALNIRTQGEMDKAARTQRIAAQQRSGLLKGVSTAFSAYTADSSTKTIKASDDDFIGDAATESASGFLA